MDSLQRMTYLDSLIRKSWATSHHCGFVPQHMKLNTGKVGEFQSLLWPFVLPFAEHKLKSGENDPKHRPIPASETFPLLLSVDVGVKKKWVEMIM